MDNKLCEYKSAQTEYLTNPIGEMPYILKMRPWNLMHTSTTFLEVMNEEEDVREEVSDKFYVILKSAECKGIYKSGWISNYGLLLVYEYYLDKNYKENEDIFHISTQQFDLAECGLKRELNRNEILLKFTTMTSDEVNYYLYELM